MNKNICLLLLALLAFPAMAQEEIPPCEQDSVFHRLDFWLGDWEVFDSGGQKVGENTISPILKNCAIEELWTDADGSEGKSLFYFDTVKKRWTQIWITENSLRPGGLKQKYLVRDFGNKDNIRFQGKYPDRKGREILDRTTLMKQRDGNVRQIIEISKDDGVNWRVVFDAMYKRKQ